MNLESLVRNCWMIGKKTDGLVAVLLAFSFPQKVTLQFSRREEIQTLIVLRIGFHLNVAFCDQNSMV